MTVLPPEIVPLESISSHPNLLVFANSGAGKTVFATSDDSVLLLNTEPEGEISAKNLGSKAKKWDIRSVNDLDRCYNWALNLAEKGQEIPFKWFVIDSLTEYQDIEMREILRAGTQKKSAKDPVVPEWQDYLRNQKRLIRRIKEFNALPVNMLYTALARNATDADGNEFIYPQIHGKGYEVAQLVLAQMTSFGYLFVKNQYREIAGKKQKVGVNRFIVWEDSGTMQGKDRTTALAPYTKLPDKGGLKFIRQKIEEAGLKSMKTEVTQQDSA